MAPSPTMHPLAELRAARAEVLAALRGCRASDLLRTGTDGEWCGRDALLHMAAWLRELTTLVPELAAHDPARGAPSLRVAPAHATVDWMGWNGANVRAHRAVRPEAALASFVTAHARLLDRVATIDEAGLRRHSATRCGVSTNGWDVLRAEAAHERAHAACLTPRTSGAGPSGACRRVSGPLLRAS